MEYSGAGGKLIHEKNQKQKISWHYPFKVNFSLDTHYQSLDENWKIKYSMCKTWKQ